VKDLSLLGRDIRRCVIVDNHWYSFLRHPENGIECSNWDFDTMNKNYEKDNELRVIQASKLFHPQRKLRPEMRCLYVVSDGIRFSLPQLWQDFLEVIDGEEDVRPHLKHWRRGKDYELSMVDLQPMK
jgi:hypothetical protein